MRRERGTGAGRTGYLLERNPVKGLAIPKEESPKRALLAEEQYEKIRKAAAAESSSAEAFVVLAWHTGHRAASIRQLRWEDVDLKNGRVHWRADADKIALDHWKALHSQPVAVLQRLHAVLDVLGEDDRPPWIVPAQRDPKKPAGRDTINKLWQRVAVTTGTQDQREGLR